MFCLLSRRSGPSLRPLVLRPPRLGTRASGHDPQLLKFSQLWKPALFACGFTGVAFATAAICTVERHRRRHRSLIERFRIRCQKQLGLNDGQFVAAGIAVLNTIVFACTRVKRCHSFMQRYFMLSAMRNQPSCLPLLLATFNHVNIFHLSINMFVLSSFAQSGVAVLGREQFLALYVSAGVFSSLVSTGHKVLAKCYKPSLGASGALLAIFAVHCLFFPDSRIQVVFLPFLGTTAGTALPAMAAFDAAGLLFRWQMLDHAAHLGGAAFGCLYYLVGQNLYQQYGTRVARSWNRIRSGR